MKEKRRERKETGRQEERKEARKEGSPGRWYSDPGKRPFPIVAVLQPSHVFFLVSPKIVCETVSKNSRVERQIFQPRGASCKVKYLPLFKRIVNEILTTESSSFVLGQHGHQKLIAFLCY